MFMAKNYKNFSAISNRYVRVYPFKWKYERSTIVNNAHSHNLRRSCNSFKLNTYDVLFLGRGKLDG